MDLLESAMTMLRVLLYPFVCLSLYLLLTMNKTGRIARVNTKVWYAIILSFFVLWIGVLFRVHEMLHVTLDILSFVYTPSLLIIALATWHQIFKCTKENCKDFKEYIIEEKEFA